MAGDNKTQGGRMTATPRLFTAAGLAADEEIAATQGQAHYLGAVMRRAPGDALRLFNGRDGEWSASILAIKRDRAMLCPHARLRPQASEPDLWLAFAPLKRDATELLIQKATELGVSALLPVLTERTNATRLNVERLACIATEAAEQSERLTVPGIRAPVSLAQLIATWPPGRTLAAAIERGAPYPAPKAASLLTGPEGGFSPGELLLLSQASFVSPIWLGPLVLRAETAALAGLVLLQARGWGI